jgi:hypothetical protein
MPPPRVHPGCPRTDSERRRINQTTTACKQTYASARGEVRLTLVWGLFGAVADGLPPVPATGSWALNLGLRRGPPASPGDVTRTSASAFWALNLGLRLGLRGAPPASTSTSTGGATRPSASWAGTLCWLPPP